MAKEAHVVNRYQLKLDLFTLFILLYREVIKKLSRWIFNKDSN